MQAFPPPLWLTCLRSIIDFSPLTVEPETPVLEAIALMAKSGKSALVGSASQIVGWLTERDVVKLVASGVDLKTSQMCEVMHAYSISLQLSEFADLKTVLSLMQQHQLDLLPVVDEQGQLVGTVTAESICQALQAELRETSIDITEFQQVQADLEARVAKRTQSLRKINQQLVDEMSDRPQAPQELEQSEARWRFLAETIPQQVWIAQADGSIEYVNQRFLDYFGCTKEQILDWKWQQWKHPEDLPQCLDAWQKSLATGETFEIESRWLRAADNTYRWHLVRALPWYDQQGKIVNWFGTNTDIHDRKLIEQALAERVRLADFRADVDTILTQSHSLKDLMHGCTEAVVQHLDAAFARIWMLNKQENVLELQVSSGIYTHIDGYHQRIPVGEYKIGLIAQQGKPHLTNSVLTDPRISQKDWAQREGMIAFAGYPLIVEGETLGVMAMFSRQELTESTLKALEIAADEIAFGIKRQLIEAALKHSEERFRNLVEASSDWVWEVNENAVYTYASPKVRDILGYTPQEIIGKTLFELMPPEEGGRVANIFAPIAAAQQPFKCLENINIHQDGHLVVLETSGEPIFDTEGKFRGYRGMDRDITERKLVEESLLRFRKAIESTSDAVVIADSQGQCIYVNPAFVEIYGYTLEELQAAGGATVIFQQPQQCEQILATVMSGQSWRGETTMRARSGGIVQIDLRSDAIKDVTGKIIGKVCIHTDITQRQQAESDLWLRDRAIAASSNGIVIIDVRMQDEPIIYVNPAFERMTGYCAAEVIGQSRRWLQHADIKQPELQQLSTAMQTGQDCTVILRNSRKDGSLFWNQLNISPVCDVDGELTHYIGIQTDITERKQLEKDLRVALETEKELKSRFISMISHEFRTPLSTILSSSELLEHYRHKWTEEKQLTHLHRIQSAVKRMTEMLNDVLFMGKAETGILDYRPTSLDLVAYCRHLVEDLELSLNNQHQISFTSEFDFMTCNMDNKLLEHILCNLLSNAIKYSPANSTIEFTLGCQHGQAIFQIRDQGIGIPEQDLPDIFESFHRAQNVGNILGTGLGLAIVKNCVDIHQGEIFVTSQLGIGTTFTVTLPLK
ncbi:PAS domain S-box protein [Calothrix sp. PCC 7507]|uniref:PAS domain S-box protein n=1 Tax=Calothrix sp. PCC 7507 TaxID=99598 RepID=UPI00029F4276|nr:PAS domain S-box protein [Calothrix sp. PCC 7507]AFY35615.1 multi-sensor signal transduction histidine kinase [Calothrix sp. PCC 7507]